MLLLLEPPLKRVDSGNLGKDPIPPYKGEYFLGTDSEPAPFLPAPPLGGEGLKNLEFTPSPCHIPVGERVTLLK